VFLHAGFTWTDQDGSQTNSKESDFLWTKNQDVLGQGQNQAA
jgi:hypothetical protein